MYKGKNPILEQKSQRNITRVKNCAKKFTEKASKIHNNKYDYSKSIYRSWHSDITIICPIHGEFMMDMLHHYRGQGCKECSKLSKMSKGELKILNFLKSNNIDFEYNYYIKNDKYLSNKPYDFYLKDYNLIIEFNGEQHYKKKWFMDDKDLKNRKEIDRNKCELAKKYGYNYLILNENDDIEKVLRSTTIETK